MAIKRRLLAMVISNWKASIVNRKAGNWYVADNNVVISCVVWQIASGTFALPNHYTRNWTFPNCEDKSMALFNWFFRLESRFFASAPAVIARQIKFRRSHKAAKYKSQRKLYENIITIQCGHSRAPKSFGISHFFLSERMQVGGLLPVGEFFQLPRSDACKQRKINFTLSSGRQQQTVS